MKTIKQKSIAKIEVQKSFCKRCQLRIKDELQKIEDIGNINLYPDCAMVVFSFFRANELAVALNKLTELGYPEIGEVPSRNNCVETMICSC